MKSEKRIALLTNDVETTSLVNHRLSDKTGEKVLKEGMPFLLDLYEKHNIKSTFFFTGYIAKKFPDIVKMILPYGHEVASHGMYHDAEFSFDILSYKDQLYYLEKSKDILENLAGTEVATFRAPALRVNHNTPKALIKSGFQIDSSVSSQRFDFLLSLGSKEKLKWLKAPRLPYYVSENDIFKKGESSLLEVPVSAFLMPYIGTTMRILPAISRLIRNLLTYENHFTTKPINFLIHPVELMTEERESDTIQRRSKYYLKYLLADKLRYYLKLKNLGDNCSELYEKDIVFLNNKTFNFITLSDFSNLVKKK